MYSFINGVLPITFSMMIRLPAFFFQGTQKIKKMDAFTTYIKAKVRGGGGGGGGGGVDQNRISYFG